MSELAAACAEGVGDAGRAGRGDEETQATIATDLSEF
jgi:hypothetical protein